MQKLDGSFDKSCKTKRKKNIMREFVIKEISAVDYGAQAPAKAVLLKREADEIVEKLITMTSESEGHQHLLHIGSYELEEGGGSTNYAVMSNSEKSEDHSHPFVIEDDGTVTIGANAGHTHELKSAFVRRLTMPVRTLSVQQSTDVIEIPSTLTKSELGKDFVAGDFALVEDPNDPRTWKYRLVASSGCNPCRRQVGNAVTALKRGEVPKDQQMSVIRRVRAAWIKANSSGTTQMPAVLKRVSLD